jgi:hypothetical protein
MKNWKPIFVENSWLPRILSYISPVSIRAITFGFIVFNRGEVNEQTKLHETIHFQQFLETLFIGFLILYFYDWIKGYITYKNAEIAYFMIRAEQEAYNNEKNKLYLTKRKRWKWITE